MGLNLSKKSRIKDKSSCVLTRPILKYVHRGNVTRWAGEQKHTEHMIMRDYVCSLALCMLGWTHGKLVGWYAFWTVVKIEYQSFLKLMTAFDHIKVYINIINFILSPYWRNAWKRITTVSPLFCVVDTGAYFILIFLYQRNAGVNRTT